MIKDQLDSLASVQTAWDLTNTTVSGGRVTSCTMHGAVSAVICALRLIYHSSRPTASVSETDSIIKVPAASISNWLTVFSLKIKLYIFTVRAVL